MKVDFTRPLSGPAIDLIRSIPIIGAGEFVFTNNGRQPFGAFGQIRDLHERSGTSGWTLHDCRRSARSLMSRAGVSADIAERCLGHVIPGVRGIYDRYEFHDEKRRAYELLAQLIQRIVNPPEDNVVQLAAAQ